MAVYKEKDGSWRVIYRYTDWKGERKQTKEYSYPLLASVIGTNE